MATTVAEVMLWGTRIGAVAWSQEQEYGEFQYSDALIGSGIEPCPITMPVRRQAYSFQSLSKESFKGLPGMLADTLPDKFGNALIDQWLAGQGRNKSDFNPVERLCYIGNRGMGALEYIPILGENQSGQTPIDIKALVELASDILKARKLELSLGNKQFNKEALTQILEVGTSAGGARAKAVIAWNQQTHTVHSGHIPPQAGFDYWLLKFDGVDENSDKELNDPLGFGRIEYAYYLCALAAGIDMTECRLLEENGRAHFMTKRFDRDAKAGKQHMLSLCGIAHYDYQQAGAYSYEQAFQVCLKLNLPMEDKLELFRRMSFNIIMRNQDDHTKNISFIMDRSGTWRLSPAYDVTYSYNPKGDWTSQHQMSVNGKRDNFETEDLMSVAKISGLNSSKCKKIINDVQNVALAWQEIAESAEVNPRHLHMIQSTLRSL